MSRLVVASAAIALLNTGDVHGLRVNDLTGPARAAGARGRKARTKQVSQVARDALKDPSDTAPVEEASTTATVEEDAETAAEKARKQANLAKIMRGGGQGMFPMPVMPAGGFKLKARSGSPPRDSGRTEA